MIYLPNIPNMDAPEKPEDEITLRPVRIVHEDGTNAMAYVQDLTTHADLHRKSHRLHKRLTIIYLAVGTVALALSAYATIKTVHKT